MSSPPAEGDLQLEDLLPDMMTCGSLDPGPDPTWAEAWAVTDALIAEMARRCAEAGVDFAVLL